MTFTIPELQQLLAVDLDWRNHFDGSLDYHVMNHHCAQFIGYESYESYNAASIKDVREHIQRKIAELSATQGLTNATLP